MGLPPEENTIGMRLTHIRAQLSQREFASQLGVPLRTYQTYEQGQREPDLRTLLGLHARGWDLNWVLAGDGRPRRDDADRPARLAVGEAPAVWPTEGGLRQAVELAETASAGESRMAPEGYARLLTLIHGALESGLPAEQVLAFARPAARGLRTAEAEAGNAGPAG